ncbi:MULTISPECIES: hypothetical protein [unclassified Bradyrhizobium]|uniref:hypothetical protein n=1 Tax=unclassified Bradyrhizobium TaxID=2631580 RepID=UPI0024784FDE|nr:MULTISPECIES: hypothetical protein [unclassified Bradyrhizobium]WGS18637.1 hypothetical protein MTX22_29370 [Bradyrhizobium sp. ISRA463]WGS25460.1 hypothetical protein MTX19_26950 [Bradyrhizobium sp. ISRA464]
MSRKMKTPERKLRHQGHAAQITNAGDRPSNIVRPAAVAWPFNPQDVSPLAWWRTLSSDLFRDAPHLLVRATLERITLLHGDNRFATALRGDPAAAIAEAFSLMPISEITLKTDIAMTAALQCVLDGDAAASLVLTNVLCRTQLDHPFALEVAASWSAQNGRRSPNRRRSASTTKPQLPALRQFDDDSLSDGGAA